MTDRVNSLLVVLDIDLREDDVHLQNLITAILMFRGVSHVGKNIVGPSDFAAECRARNEFQEKIRKIMQL